MSKHKVEYDKNGVCTLVDSKIKFLQVSLKKARGGAQLGKITGDYSWYSELKISKQVHLVNQNDGLCPYDFFLRGVCIGIF